MTESFGAAVARLLMVAIQHVRHYGPDHPNARNAVRQFADALQAELARTPSVRLEVGEWLMVQSTALPAGDRYAGQLRDHLAARQVERLVLHRNAQPDRLAALVRLLALEPEELIAEGGVEGALAGMSDAVVGKAPGEPPAGVAPPADPYAAAVVIAGEIADATERGSPIDVARAHLAVQGIADGLVRDRAQVWTQVAHRGHDELDPAHAVNTAVFSLLMAEAFAAPAEHRIQIGVAALLHDIGLAALPWERRLTERAPCAPQPSWRHPVEGGYLLRHLGARESLAMVVALEHHLPALGEASELLAQSRLVSLADYVDGQTCGRAAAHRPAALGELLTRLLRGEGPRFDARHVTILATAVHQAGAQGAACSG